MAETNLIIPRRKFLLGLAGLFCAPAIVKAESLMRIAAPTESTPFTCEDLVFDAEAQPGPVFLVRYRINACKDLPKFQWKILEAEEKFISVPEILVRPKGHSTISWGDIEEVHYAPKS